MTLHESKENTREKFTDKELDDDGGLAAVSIDVTLTNIAGISAHVNVVAVSTFCCTSVNLATNIIRPRPES